MKKIIDFNEFLIDLIIENMKKRSKVDKLELVLSPRLIKILKEINHKIADSLLSMHMESDEPEHKMTFVDLGSEPNKVSFIQSNRVPDLIEPDIVHGPYNREFDDEGNYKGGFFDYVPMYNNPWISDQNQILILHDKQFKSKDHPVWKTNRSEITIQRFVNKIFPDKFPVNHKREELDKMDKPDDVESFGNLFIATVEAHSKQLQLREGEDVRHFYNCNNYFKGGGTLGGSCMRDASASKFLDIYVKNVGKVQILVLFPEDEREKIIGRAIVWKLDGADSGLKGRYFMDRVYTANDSDTYIFLEYAKAKGWLYKETQSYGMDYNIIDSKDKSTKRRHLSVDLDTRELDYYPYMDTMQLYNPQTGNITNDAEYAREKKGYIKLQNTGGDYQRFS